MGAFILIVLIASTSCVYYNTFYNAEKYFESAQKQPLRDNGRPAPRAIQDYDKVIDRCVYILREHQDSRWADDALFLMARSLYYKKQNLLQAKERFNDMLRIYPDSEFIPDTHIYIAKIDYEMGKKEEAYRRLNDLLNNSEFGKYHSEVYLLKSKYHAEENDYVRAQQHLQYIIDRHPNSKEYEQAYYDLGKSYLDNGEYEESIKVFEKFLKTRSARRIKMNARYEIALNYYNINNFDQSIRILDKLLKDEYELKEIPKLSLLKARCLIKINELAKAEELFLSIVENNPRTEISAEACYYLAEMYFLHSQRYEDAIEYYNKIQTENRSSTFVQAGVSRSAVVSQIIQFSETDRTISTSDLINEQLKLAEYYLYVMNLPDSALNVYSHISKQEKSLKAKRDSLALFISEADEISDEYQESQTEESDTTQVALQEEVSEEEAPKEDSKQNDLVQLEEDLVLYNEEFIPYAMFSSAWVLLNVKDERDKAEEILAELEKSFPENRYTNAAKALLSGEKVLFATDEEIEFEKEYEKAITHSEKRGAESYSALKELLDKLNDIETDSTRTMPKTLSEMKQKTTFSLGYVSYFVLEDSTQAKPFFNELLKEDKNSQYSTFINKFYRNEHFIVSKTFLKEEEEEEIETEEAIPDSLSSEPSSESEELMLEEPVLADTIQVSEPFEVSDIEEEEIEPLILQIEETEPTPDSLSNEPLPEIEEELMPEEPALPDAIQVSEPLEVDDIEEEEIEPYLHQVIEPESPASVDE